MNKIQQITKDCPREDCSIISRGSASTLMGWTPTYDKHGQRTDNGDPNTTTTHFECTKCNKNWLAKTQYGKTEITETVRP